jgi:hypothetical protein
MLEGCLDDDGDIADEIVVYDVKEEVGHNPIGRSGELIVLYTKSIDVPLFDFIATNDWHTQLLTELLGQCGLARARPAGDDDAFRLTVHIPECPTSRRTNRSTHPLECKNIYFIPPF